MWVITKNHRFLPCLLLGAALWVTGCGGGGAGGTKQSPSSSAESSISSSAGNTAADKEMVLNLVAPEDNALVAVDHIQDISLNFTNTTANRLVWEILPSGLAANARIIPLSDTPTSAKAAFTAEEPGIYTVRVRSQDDDSRQANLQLRVHQTYAALDNKSALQTDGRLSSLLDGAPATSDFIAVATGGHGGIPEFGIAAKANGTVVSWGNPPAPVPAGLTNVKTVAAGYYHALAIREDNSLVVWGEFNGASPRLPASLDPAIVAADVLTGSFVAIEADGDLVVWDDDGTVRPNPVAVQGKKFKQVCATTWHVIAVDEDGSVYSWNPINKSDPILNNPPATSAPVATVFCGVRQAALLQTDGRVLTWGEIWEYFDSDAIDGFPAVKSIAMMLGYILFLTDSGLLMGYGYAHAGMQALLAYEDQ